MSLTRLYGYDPYNSLDAWKVWEHVMDTFYRGLEASPDLPPTKA
jgi:hypothetical protein